MQTANCVKITSMDHKSENGIVHVTDGVLKPVTSTLIELIQKNPELSIMKTGIVLNVSAISGRDR